MASAVPVKSKAIVSPSIVAVTRIGVNVTPSGWTNSITSSKRYSPSGQALIAARVSRSL